MTCGPACDLKLILNKPRACWRALDDAAAVGSKDRLGSRSVWRLAAPKWGHCPDKSIPAAAAKSSAYLVTLANRPKCPPLQCPRLQCHGPALEVIPMSYGPLAYQ